jgi:hypothetical protein
MPRYQTTGIPPVMARLGLSAFMPHYTRLAASGAQVYKYGVTGHPGTARIPVTPRTAGIPPSPDPGDISQMGLSRGSDAPDAFWPNLYYMTTSPEFDSGGGTAKVQIYNTTRPQDTTMIPVPATDLRGLYQARTATLAGGIDNRREKALKQAMSFARWGRRAVGNGSDQ